MDENLNMDELVESCKISISEHCYKRYAERIKHRESAIEINNFVRENRDKISIEIKKLFLSSEHVYTGSVGNNTTQLNFYVNKNGWTLLADPKKDVLVTLYKVDLDVDDQDLNQAYVEKALAKIKARTEELEFIKAEVAKNKITLQEEYDSNLNEINMYKQLIGKLEGRNAGLKSLLNNADADIYQAKFRLKQAVEDMCAKDKLKVIQLDDKF